MNDARADANCDRARAIGTRISRWRRGSSRPRHRGPILAFYDFVRTADDIADHATLPPAEKLALLDRLEASLLGKDDSDAGRGAAARASSPTRNLSPRHAHDLLDRVPLDVTKLRYATGTI